MSILLTFSCIFNNFMSFLLCGSQLDSQSKTRGNFLIGIAYIFFMGGISGPIGLSVIVQNQFSSCEEAQSSQLKFAKIEDFIYKWLSVQILFYFQSVMLNIFAFCMILANHKNSQRYADDHYQEMVTRAQDSYWNVNPVRNPQNLRSRRLLRRQLLIERQRPQVPLLSYRGLCTEEIESVCEQNSK